MPRPYFSRARNQATAYPPRKAAPAYTGQGPSGPSVNPMSNTAAQAPIICRNMEAAYHG